MGPLRVSYCRFCGQGIPWGQREAHRGLPCWLARQGAIGESIDRDIARLPVWMQYVLEVIIFALFFPWSLFGLVGRRKKGS